MSRCFFKQIFKLSLNYYSTGKALAGGISSAKGALSSWITSFKHPQQPQEQGRDTVEDLAHKNGGHDQHEIEDEKVVT